MEKNDFYYYEKEGEIYAMKMISEYDIDYSIKASHHAYMIWQDLRLSISRKLKYYSLQEDGYLYFEMKESIPKSVLNKLTVDDTIRDITIYNVPKELVSKCVNLFLSEDKEKVLWVYTDKSKFCDSAFMEPHYGKASVYDLTSYLADNQYRMMLNEDLFLNISEVYAICDYPIHKSSISCEIRDVYKTNHSGYIRVMPKKDRGELLKEFKDRLKYHKEYQKNDCLDIAINVSKHIKDSADEIKTIVKIAKKEVDDGMDINLLLCVKNKKQKEIVNDLIDNVFNPKRVLH